MILPKCSNSNNPAWPFLNASNGGWNGVFLFFALIASGVQFSKQISPSVTRFRPPITRRPSPLRQRVAGILSLGALIHLLHMTLSDSGTLIAWTWTGYPIQG